MNYFAHRSIDSELSSFKRNLQMKQAMGYGLSHRDIAQLQYLNAKQEEMNQLKQNAEKRKRSTQSQFSKKLTIDDIVAVFRQFDLDEDDTLNVSEFCSLISSLLHVRNREAPTQEKTFTVVNMLIKNFVYQSRRRNSRNLEGISLSDFVYNAVHGDIGRLISEAHRVSRDVVGSLRLLKKTDPEIVPGMSVSKEQKVEEEVVNDTLDSSDDEVDFHDCSTENTTEDTENIKVEETDDECDSESESSDDNSDNETDDDDDVAVEHSFVKGEMLIYRRPQDESCRTVTVVELLEDGGYVVEHEVETTFNHIKLPEGETQIMKGTKVIYKSDSEARVLQVGSADTFDEEGRPSYLIAVKTHTDSSRLSRENS